jgi:L-serine dehydratase
LYGSFADTFRGHGTDLAVVGGILDFDTDDERIPHSLELAASLGIGIDVRPGKGLAAHPNTAEIKLVGAGRKALLKGASIGGGTIEVEQVNGFDVRFSAVYPTLLIFHADRMGMIAEITGLLSRQKMNIGSMDLDRKGRSGDALTVIESDSGFNAELLESLAAIPDVGDIRIIDWTEGSM